MATLQQTILLQYLTGDRLVGATLNQTCDSHFQSAIRAVGTVEETIALDADIVDPGFMYVRNWDSYNYVDIGFATSNYPCRVYAGEMGCIPLSLTTNTIYVKANTASCDLEYFVTERQGITPSASPSASPSATPTASVSVTPTTSPSATPTTTPTASSSVTPTASPTASPTTSPSGSPSTTPTTSPSPT